MLCTCRQKFRVFQVGEGNIDLVIPKPAPVRILRSTVMVCVGGGWLLFDEFLQKNDPCRADEHLAELMPIFERIRAQEQVPCAFPIHMGAGGTVFVRCNSSRSVPLSPHVLHCHPTTHWVRERSVRSIPMSKTANTRSSLSASTPDSLSDNEGLTPGGSRAGSKPNSRPLSRQGSKPPSRHGSTLSLDSTAQTFKFNFGYRYNTKTVKINCHPSSSRTNGTITRKTASGSASPAPTSPENTCSLVKRTCRQGLQNLTTSHHVSAAQAPQPMVGEDSPVEVNPGYQPRGTNIITLG
ncbi:hypothetical protein EVAR_66927_1 [Eumeta japonica]|uniref:GAR domain-containing protein n=1 Tax=Eumeta variegata TaxID=151549 RepID=A0A4C2A1V7_EUMVA|nr:hypothetical protein EVAR_66927_1 [Eumeta japonica]